jgi:hypothetical protein
MMNERIKLLAEQAGVKYSLWVGSKPAAYMTYDELEKFAEMLVEECARIGELKEQGYEEYDPDLSVGWYMKQHFGVEE